MTIKNPDIDIDFADREEALSCFEVIPASRYDLEKNDLIKHNSGVYFQNIPQDPVTELAAIPYEEAEKRGYFKIDFLNLSLYKGVKDEDHLISLIEQEPCWELLRHEEFVEQLDQISRHYEIVSAYHPESIEELAMVLALIRPGKKHLVGLPFDEIRGDIWKKSDDKYDFKKSHAIAYAQAIAVQLNLICEQFPEECDDTTKIKRAI